MAIIDTETTEGKAALKEQIEEAISELSAKNKELLAEVREARKGRTIDPKEIESRDNEIETLKAQLGDANKAVKLATTEHEKAKKALEGAEGFTQKLLVDNGLTDALTKAGVTNPVHLKAAKSMLAGQVAIVADGDNRSAKMGDKDLLAAVGEWAKGDEGKFFVQATQNNGGGAGGSGGGGGANGKAATRAQFDAMNHVERATFAKDGGKVTD